MPKVHALLLATLLGGVACGSGGETTAAHGAGDTAPTASLGSETQPDASTPSSVSPADPEAGAAGSDASSPAPTTDDGGSGASSATVKWFPTVLAQTVNVNSDVNGERSEIDVLAASFAQYPALAGATSWKVGDPLGADPIVGGYALWRFWRDLETSTGTYDASTIFATLAYLEEKIPGARLGIGVGCYANWGKAFDASAGQRAIPDYIFQGDVATYGHAPPGGNGAGWGFGSYQGAATPTYNFVFAALWNASTMNRWNQLFVELGKLPVPTMTVNGVVYAGYTVDTHPLIEMMNDFTPDDFGIPNNGSPAIPVDYDATTFQANWMARSATLAAGLPHLSMALMPGFGFSSGSDQAAKVESMDRGRMAMSTTDTKAYNGAAQPDLSDGLHAFLGDSYDGQTSTWTTGGGVDHRGKMPMMPTLQALDYSKSTPGYAHDTEALVKLILGFAYQTYHSDHFLISLASSTTYDPGHDWAGSTGFIAPALVAMGGIPAKNQELPVSYMVPVSGLVKTGESSFAWNAVSAGPGVSYVVFRDGAVLAAAVTATSFTVPSPGAAGHAFTVAMANDNGSGPRSAALAF